MSFVSILLINLNKCIYTYILWNNKFRQIRLIKNLEKISAFDVPKRVLLFPTYSTSLKYIITIIIVL